MEKQKIPGAVETGETGYGFKLAIPKARCQAAHRQARGLAKANISTGGIGEVLRRPFAGGVTERTTDSPE